MENYQNLVGKLLAGENITILQKRMETAAFDIEKRTLYLPIWKDMTPEINDMLICHEVSHALFTPMDYVDALKNRLKFKNAKSYLNILEDIRVEKLIKKKYPGIRKSFAQGYKQLNDKDFFGAKKKDLTKAHLMDRINLFYKVGFDANVEFSEDEKLFVDRAMNTETIQDVIQLAEDIFKFIRERKEDDVDSESKPFGEAGEDYEDEMEMSSEGESESGEKGKNADKSESGESDDESATDKSESGESDDEGDEGDEESKSKSSGGSSSHTNDGTDQNIPDEEFDDGEITTDDAFSKNAKDLVNMTEDRIYLDIADLNDKKIVSYKDILSLYDETRIPESVLSAIKKFKSDTNPTVSYLVKEFEMKKAASSYKRTSIAKSGIIDTKKLYAYQIKDDLFKRMSITKDGKNHGMVILLDWSGSMRYVIQDVLKQAITLIMFCKRVNIPFQVFAFVDSVVPKQWRDLVDTANDYSTKSSDKITTYNCWYLMEFFSDKMNNTDMNKMINFLLSYGVSNIVPLNGTPLTQSLLFMYNYLDTFKKSNNVEKLSFITLTDGQGGAFGHFSDVYLNGKQKVQKRYFIKTNTKKMIEFSGYSAVSQVNSVMSAIKERYKCTNVGFFIASGSEYKSFLQFHYEQFDRNNSRQNQNYNEMEVIKKDIQSQMKKNDVAILDDVVGRDKMFYVNGSKLKIKDTELDINPDANVKKIAKDFTKHLIKKKVSRVLLNEFIKIIA